MKKSQLIATQTAVGTTPDGYWGPKSIAACREHLRSLMPNPNPWPATDQASLTAFYGHPGDEDNLTRIDVNGLGVEYAGSPVRQILCHKRVAASLLRILTAISKGPHAAILRDYEGCYNDRPMRGGSIPSLHARGAAIDLSADENGNLVSWPVAATMPIEVMEEFAKEGWIAAGAFWGRDAMHFQATR